jgi:hypothetical protein
MMRGLASISNRFGFHHCATAASAPANAGSPFYAAIVVQIVLAVFQFVRLILLPPSPR